MAVPQQTGYPTAPFEPDETIHRKKISHVLRNIVMGKVNCHLDVTLNPTATSTVISDARIGFNSVISPAMALTADGATAIASGIYVASSSITPAIAAVPGQAIISHASNSSLTQVIRFLLIG